MIYIECFVYSRCQHNRIDGSWLDLERIKNPGKVFGCPGPGPMLKLELPGDIVLAW